MKRAKRNKRIKYGNVHLDDSYWDPKNQKHKVSFWMDGDLKAELKKRAAEVGAGYQTYMHKILRDAVFDSDSLVKH